MTQPHRPVGPGDHVFLVDGSSFVFRAYYQSIRQDQKYNYRSDRLPIGAVRLFATKVLQFVNDGAAGIKPTHLAIIFDKSENSFRKRVYPAYKSHRKDPPDDLVPQFPLMRATVRAFGMVPVEQDSYEADDLIATYARQARERGADVLIVSADKDLMQLIGPGVAMYDPRLRARPARSGASASAEVVDYFGVGAGQGRRRPGARRRFDRQRARRARHRRQDRRPAHRRIWRPRHAARPRRRDQAAEAARGADPAGERQPHPHFAESWSRWCATCRSRRRSTTSPRPTLDGEELVAFLKAMELTTHHAPGRRDLRRRRLRRSSPTRASSARPAGAAATARRRWRREQAAAAAAARPRRAKLGAPHRRATPADLAGARRGRSAGAVRPQRPTRPCDSLDELERLDRARARGRASSPSTSRRRRPIRCRPTSSAFRSRVAPGEACYVPLGHRVGADDLFDGGGLAPDQIAESGRDRAAEAAARSAGRAQDRPERQVRHARPRPPRRRPSRRSTTRC